MYVCIFYLPICAPFRAASAFPCSQHASIAIILTSTRTRPPPTLQLCEVPNSGRYVRNLVLFTLPRLHVFSDSRLFYVSNLFLLDSLVEHSIEEDQGQLLSCKLTTTAAFPSEQNIKEVLKTETSNFTPCTLRQCQQILHINSTFYSWWLVELTFYCTCFT